MNHIAIISGQYFQNWNGNECVVEIPSLPNRGNNLFNRVYPDAMDVGFIVESQRTLERRLFILSHTDEHDDGDVMGWHFTSRYLVSRDRGEYLSRFDQSGREFKILIINVSGPPNIN
jgi:hypothetical protein